MRYVYCREATRGSVGYFYCRPEKDLALDEIVALLKAGEGGEHLKRFFLHGFDALSPEERRKIVVQSLDETPSAPFCALLHEYVFFKGPANPLWNFLGALAAVAGGEALVRGENFAGSVRRLEDRLMLAQAANANIHAHAGLPKSGAYRDFLAAMPEVAEAGAKLAAYCGDAALERLAPAAPLNEGADLAEKARKVLDALESAALLAGPEMRHQESLSPVGLLREWRLSAAARLASRVSELSGIATAYGRGLTIPEARISLYMEIAERASAYAEITERGGISRVANRKGECVLKRATLARLLACGESVAWPQTPYSPKVWRDRETAWQECRDMDGAPVYAPAQAIYLFADLDERDIFGGVGSTGLGAGFTREYARRSALLEIIERDADAVAPFAARACFRARSRDRRIQGLLDDYEAQGIFVLFQDITSEFGVPAYRCFVRDGEGRPFAGAAAAMSGKRAALRALTETPWPYSYGAPFGKRSSRPRENAPFIHLEDLPDVSAGSAAADLRLLEERLASRGHRCVYADLTRADLDLPVCRALVPGLEHNAFFDAANIPSPRLLARQLAFLA